MPFTVLEKSMTHDIKIKIEGLSFSYQRHRVLENVTACFQENTLTAIVGPSGIGKSTFLTTLNRLWENIPENQDSESTA